MFTTSAIKPACSSISGVYYHADVGSNLSLTAATNGCLTLAPVKWSSRTPILDRVSSREYSRGFEPVIASPRRLKSHEEEPNVAVVEDDQPIPADGAGTDA